MAWSKESKSGSAKTSGPEENRAVLSGAPQKIPARLPETKAACPIGQGSPSEQARQIEQSRQSGQARQLRQTKSEFLALINHEIRTPMNAIMGLTRMVLKTSLNSAQRDCICKIQSAAGNLLSIVNDILDVSDVDSGQLRLEEAPFTMEGLMTGLSILFEPRSRAKGLQFNLRLHEGVPGKLVGDSARLSKVLSLLLDNAFKFTEQGEVSVDCRLEERLSGKVRLRFVVEDSGIGMGQAERERLFSDFWQADGTRSRKYGGTGLGLGVAQRLARLMDGGLGVRSRQGRGTRISFTCVLREFTANCEDSFNFCGQEVLLVEDNEINQEIALDLLGEVGLKTSLAANGREALRLIEERGPANPFDLVLMDLQMPEMDGFAATRAIRALPGYGRVPILALTAHAFEEERRQCLLSGMDGHVSKPIDAFVLYRTMHEKLNRGTGH